MKQERIQWVDQAKGFGMVLVILGHTSLPGSVSKFIYTFHMPLFFFISGYLLCVSKYPSLKDFVARKTKTLIIPYLCFSAIVYVWWVLFQFYFRSQNKIISTNLLKPIIGTFYAVRNSDWTPHTGPLWFVLALFLAEVLFYLIVKGCKGNVIKVILTLLGCSLLGYLYSVQIHYPLPLSADVSITAVVFVGVGSLVREYKLIDRFFNIGTFVALIIVSYIFGAMNTFVDLFSGNYGNYFLFYLSAFSGVGATVMFVKSLNGNRLFSYIGRNSITYLALHQSIVFVSFDLVLKYLFQIKKLEDSIITGFIFTIITVVSLIPVNRLLNTKVSYVVGKSPNLTI